MIHTDLKKSFYLVTQDLGNIEDRSDIQSKELETRLKIAETALISFQSINEMAIRKAELYKKHIPELMKESLDNLENALSALSDNQLPEVATSISQLAVKIKKINSECYTTDIQDVILDEFANFERTENALALFKQKIDAKLFDDSIDAKTLTKFLQGEITEEQDALREQLIELFTFYREKIHNFQSIPVEHIHSIAIFGHSTPELVSEENALREELHAFHIAHHDELVLRFTDGKFALQQLHYKNFELASVTPILEELHMLSIECTSFGDDIENIKQEMDKHGNKKELEFKSRCADLQTRFIEINTSIASINLRLKKMITSVEWLPEENPIDYFIKKSTLKYQHSTEENLWKNLLFQPEDFESQTHLIYRQAELIVETHRKIVDKISQKWDDLRTHFSNHIEDQLNRTNYSVETNDCKKIRQFLWDNYYQTKNYAESSPTQSIQEMLRDNTI